MSKARLLHVQVPVPSYFVCPISLELMLDPVTLSSGQTFDRSSIEKWFDDGHATCPVTRQPINVDDEEPIPNHTLRRMIQAWCEQNQSLGVQRIVTPRQPPSVKDVPSLVESLLRLPSRGSSDHDAADAIQKLVSLASDRPKSRRLIADHAFPHAFKLLSCFCSSTASSSSLADHVLRLLDLLTTDDLDVDLRRNLFDSSSDLDHQLLLPLASLAARGRPETRACAIRVLLRMPLSEAMKKKLSSSPGLMEGLVEMVAKKDGAAMRGSALRLILELCRGCQRGRIAAVEANVVPCVAELLLDGSSRDDYEGSGGMKETGMEVMEMVCHCAEGRAAMASRVDVVVRHMSGVSERVSYLALHTLWLLLKSSPDSHAVKATAFRNGALVKAVAIAQSAAPGQTRHVARNVSAALLPLASNQVPAKSLRL